MNARTRAAASRSPAPGTPAAADDETQRELETPAEVGITDDVEVDELISNLGASAAAARIIVHRIEANQDPEECIDCPLPVFSKDHLREQFGPGRYRCEVRHKGVIKRRWEWRFAAPRGQAIAPKDPGSTRLAELEAELRASREAESKRSHDMMLALLGRPQSQGPQLSDLVDILSKTRELLGGGGGNGESKSPIAQLKELLEVRDLLGGGEGGSSPTDVALEGLKALREAFTLAPAQPAQPGAGAGASKALPAAPGSSRISAALSMLLKHAAAGTPAEKIAPFVLQAMQQLPDAEYEAICSFLEQDGALGLLLLAEPGLANFRPWAEQVLAQLRAQIGEEGQEGQPTQPA